MKIGCSGFAVARERYFRELEAVELEDCFYKPPRPATAEAWRAEAPEGFQFFLKAWQLITHPSDSPGYAKLGRAYDAKRLAQCGHFKPTEEVARAWEATAALARTLKARAVLFTTPASFYPNANLLRDFYAFFKSIRRGEFALAWEPKGPWEDDVVRRVCRDLDLVHASDPLRREPLSGVWRYYRLHGAYLGRRIDYSHGFTEGELAKVAALAKGSPSYVFLSNKSKWDDARRLKRAVETGASRLVSPSTSLRARRP